MEDLFLSLEKSPSPTEIQTRGRILGRFLPCHSKSPILTVFTPPPLPSKSDLKLVCNVNIVYGNVKSENSQDYVQKPQQNCNFLNSASVLPYDAL
jgi:hypothetical protein